MDDPSEQDLHFMQLALEEARLAREQDEVPVGAVIVLDGQVIGRGHNEVRAQASPLAHAELLALQQATALRNEPRLPGATVYTTLEPCFMCAGALSHARVARVIWAVRDPKFGACASLAEVLTDSRMNHRAQVQEGLLAEPARHLLKSFFADKRAQAKAESQASPLGEDAAKGD